METIQHQEQFQYAEAYISDMLVLKNIFLQTQNTEVCRSSFGLPFLLAKKWIRFAFASLIVNEKDEISFKIYDKRMTESEKEISSPRVERYFKNNNT
jgi:hypothetical protein